MLRDRTYGTNESEDGFLASDVRDQLGGLVREARSDEGVELFQRGVDLLPAVFVFGAVEPGLQRVER